MPLTPEELRALNDPLAPPEIRNSAIQKAAEEQRNKRLAEGGGITPDQARALGDPLAPPDVAADALLAAVRANKAKRVAEEAGPSKVDPYLDPTGRMAAAEAANQRGWRETQEANRAKMPKTPLAPSAPAGSPGQQSAGAPAPGTPGGGGGSGAGGGGVAYAPPGPDPWLQAGAQIGDLKTPGEYAQELHYQVAHGLLAPDEAAKRSQAYRDRWNSAAGGALRLQSSQIAQQREADAATLAQRDEDINTRADIADMQARARAEAADRDRQAQVAQQAFQETQARQEAELAAAQQKADDFKLDKSKLWDTPGGRFSGIMAAISLLLGGVAQGVSGGRIKNPGLEAVDNVINTELRAQDFQSKQLRNAVGSQQNLMQVARQHFADDQAARAFATQQMYQHVSALIQDRIDSADTERERKAGELAKSLVDQRAADQQLAFETRLKAEQEAAKMQAAQAYAAASSQRKLAAPDEATREGKLVAYEANSDIVNRYDPSLRGYVTSPERAKEAITKLGVLSNIYNDMNELYATLNVKGESVSPTQRARAQALFAGIAPKLAVAYGQGAMSEGDKDNIEKGLPSGGVDILNTQPERLRTTMTMLDRQMAAIRESAGVIPGDKPFVTGGKWYAPMAERADVTPFEAGTGKGKREGYIVNPGPDRAPATRAVHVTPGPAPEED